ncbi:MAG: MBOAT family protein [Lachnospiraceae bacterium]|nr:MBOAT family protein [Lachnospiraceae bacterium]
MRNIWLLAASYWFYMCQGAGYALLLFFSTLVTYLSGLLMGRRGQGAGKGDEAGSPSSRPARRKKLILLLSIILNLGLLFYFKYFNFFMESVGLDPGFRILLPIGISFYVFQAVSYSVDIYREKMEPERNFINYALFLAFFPQIMSGPIGRGPSLLPQYRLKFEPDYNRIRHGLFRMLWGYFIKLVVASRLTIVVDLIFNNYDSCNGWQLLIGALAFSLQIYCDFASYSMLAVGAAEVIGIRLMENFKQPFFSLSMAELWRRWHISLTSWFRDYLYIPLGGSRKGAFRKYINILIVFTLSGLWHGAAWTFIVWGFLSGLFQVIGEITKPVRTAIAAKSPLKGPTAGRIHRIIQIIITYLLFSFTTIFFKSESLDQAWSIIKGIFTGLTYSALRATNPFQLGLGALNLGLCLFSILILFMGDLLQERTGDMAAAVLGLRGWKRWAIYYFLTTFILLSANIGAETFIYFQF